MSKLINRVKQIQSIVTTFGPLQLINFNERQLLELQTQTPLTGHVRNYFSPRRPLTDHEANSYLLLVGHGQATNRTPILLLVDH